MTRRAARRTDSRLAAYLAGAASLGAAIIHFVATPTHVQEWAPAGLFLVTIALFQLVWAGAVVSRPTATVLAAGIAANIGVVALWGISRTAGPPFGPNAGQPELAQAADLCALLLEIYVVMGAGLVWYRDQHPEQIPAVAHAVVLTGLGGVIVSATTLGAASGLQHDSHAPDTGHHAESREPAIPLDINAIPQPAAAVPVETHEHHHSE